MTADAGRAVYGVLLTRVEALNCREMELAVNFWMDIHSYSHYDLDMVAKVRTYGCELVLVNINDTNAIMHLGVHFREGKGAGRGRCP